MIIAEDIADANVEHDELSFVLELYELIVNRGSQMICDDARIEPAMQHRPEIVEPLETMLLELLINIACGKLKMHEIDGCRTWYKNACKMLNRISKRLPDWDPPVAIVAYHHMLGFWWSLYREGGTSKNEPIFENVTVGEEASQLERLDTIPH